MHLTVKTQDSSYQYNVKTLGNSQRNLALMLVSGFSVENPELEGIWLLITHPQSARITLVPVFPGDNEETRNLYASFSMTEEGFPNSTFLEAMSEYLLWDEYLLIDQQGLTSILNYFDSAVDDSLHLVIGPASQSSTRLSLDAQLGLWNSLCSYMPQVEGREQMAKLVRELAPHFSASFSWDDLPLYPWGLENIENNVSCEFPTLKMISP